MLNRLHRFLRDESATVTVEVVMVLPILLWGYFGMFILFDGYRSLSANVQASYTLSDLISREKGFVNQAYVEGMNDIQDVLTQSPHRTVLRVTMVSYNAQTQQHTLDCSLSSPGQTAVTQGSLASQILPYLPTMGDGEQLVVVETWLAFVPFLNITLRTLWDKNAYGDREYKSVFPPMYFEAFAVTRPRAAPQILCN